MNYLTLALLLLFGTTSFGQSLRSEQSYIDEGIALHDQGKYNEAIRVYQKALDIDPKHELANYEIALSYYSLKKFDEVIKHTSVAIKAKGMNLIPAYILKGSALDNSGRTEESIKLFKKAIKKTGGHYLLHYNLGLNYYNVRDRENCEKSILSAIEMKNDHATSHLLLGLLHDEMGNKVQTVLALYYFLMLEPDSERAGTAYDVLMKGLGANVEKDPNKPNTINISLSGDMDSEFMAAELMLSLMQAKVMNEEDDEEEPKTEDELFIENTTSFFTMMGEMREAKHKGVWWDLYTDFFYDLAQSEHMVAYCKHITQSKNEDSAEWLEGNKESHEAMQTWIENQLEE